MKRLIQTTLFTLIFLVHIQVSGQTFSSFYSSLAELSIPYSFSDDTHCNTSEIDLISSIQNQDQLFVNYKAVARINLGDNYSFVIIKRIFAEDLDNLFLLLVIDGNEQIVTSLAVNVKADDGRGVDFSITNEKILKVATYDDTTAEIRSYTFTDGEFLTDEVIETVPRSNLASM